MAPRWLMAAVTVAFIVVLVIVGGSMAVLSVMTAVVSMRVVFVP